MPFVSDKVTGYQKRLLFTLSVVIAAVTVLGGLLAERHFSKVAERDFIRTIERQIATVDHSQQARTALLAELCTDLSRQPRIHAALEDGALDLLYPSAANELRQIMRSVESAGEGTERTILQARFYRFLGPEGGIIGPDENGPHGALPAEFSKSLSFTAPPDGMQTGYFVLESSPGLEELVEVIAVPIISTHTFAPIGVQIVGFPYRIRDVAPDLDETHIGVRTGGRLIIPSVDPSKRHALEAYLDSVERPVFAASIQAGSSTYKLWTQTLNPASAYPPSERVVLASLSPLRLRKAQLQNHLILASAAVFITGIGMAYFTARRFSRPVEALAVASQQEHSQRKQAEMALDAKHRELERAARFSADASHQLKTPVAVMRAGLEELMMDTRFPGDLETEVHALIQQTGRLTHVIEDLLLLSRLDAGRLRLSLQPQELHLLIDALVDDLSVLPEQEQVAISVDLPDECWIEGDRIYTSLILQNLLENAHKYNRENGRIHLTAAQVSGFVECRIGNTGRQIPPEIQPHVFDRFRRGTSGERVPGYGLGLNLARELALLHSGDLRLVQSSNDWTEFAVSFVVAQAPVPEMRS